MAESNLVEYLQKRLNVAYAVGIPKNNNKMVNIGDHRKDRKGKKAGGLNYVRKVSKKINYKDLFNILNANYKFLEKIDLTTKNVAVQSLLKRMMDGFKNKIDVADIDVERAFLSLLINAINDKLFGSNAESTIYQKGFDFVMKDTGSFINQLRAWKLAEGEVKSDGSI